MAEKSIGIVGLGNMGSGMAQTLLRDGYTVNGFDLGEAQCAAAADFGVHIASDLADLCQKSHTIILSLPMAKHVQQVLLGEGGVLQHADTNTLVIDTSTSEPDVTKTLSATLADRGIGLLDCPVSGGPAGAAAGTMVMWVGGAAEHLERVRPLLDVLCSKVVYLGASGNGHTAKLINNLLCAAHLVTTAEAVALGQKAGLDPSLLIEGLNAGSGRSAVSEVNFPRWVLNEAYDSGFTMALMRKDVKLAQQLIQQQQLTLPLSEAVAEQWALSQATLADELDFNCIVTATDQGEKA